jgi:hypothetical protein
MNLKSTKLAAASALLALCASAWAQQSGQDANDMRRSQQSASRQQSAASGATSPTGACDDLRGTDRTKCLRDKTASSYGMEAASGKNAGYSGSSGKSAGGGGAASEGGGSSGGSSSSGSAGH